jgi:methionine aminotransferase
MRTLEDLLAPTDILLISDEVYEHMVFDGQEPTKVPPGYPGWHARAFIVSSFGKTYHVTGWKIGYVAAPAALTVEFRKVHQFNVFTVNTPMQHGLASYMANPAALPGVCRPSTSASATCSVPGWRAPSFRLLPSEGSYFQCVDISGLARARAPARRGRLLQMADQRGRCGRHPAVGLLRQRL